MTTIQRLAIPIHVAAMLSGLVTAASGQSPMSALTLLGQTSSVSVQEQPRKPDPFDAAHALLRPEEKSQFDGLLDLIVRLPPEPAVNPFRIGLSPRVVPAPRRLSPEEKTWLKEELARGTLRRVASDGQTVLAHLAALAKGSPRDARSTMSGSQLVVDLIRLLRAEDLQAAVRSTPASGGHPLPGGVGQITQCTVHYTCGAASIQVWMRLNRPAELVRITRQLFCEGSASQVGSSLKPARNSLRYHAGDGIYANNRIFGLEGREDRCDLDILLQSALMDKIALGNMSAYDVHLDAGGLRNVLAGNSGSKPAYVARELERLTGQKFGYQHPTFPGLVDRVALTRLAVAQLRAGKQIIVLINKSGKAFKLHFVTLVRWDERARTAYYVDTSELKTASQGAKMYAMNVPQMVEWLRAVVHPE